MNKVITYNVNKVISPKKFFPGSEPEPAYYEGSRNLKAPPAPP